MILADDFNCVLAASDSTGQRNYSRALANVEHGFHLTDAWEAIAPRKVYTHYTPTRASRIDRIYVTDNLKRRKQDVATVAAAFTDHLAVILRLSIDVPVTDEEEGVGG
jgi:endonuclease/exonuclease/phosphatase family metal-dependent hydrolase